MDDRRQVELDCLSYIFPEIEIDPVNPFTARILLPVRPHNCVNVVFSATSDTQSPITSAIREQKYETPSHSNKSYSLSYLPSLNLSITLTHDYPERSPPEINLFMNPKWLSNIYLNQLKVKARNIWEKSGGNEVLYEIIELLREATENAFGYSEKDQVLVVPEELRIPLLDFDINETQAAFKRKTFHCSICLDPKKGNFCHQMLDCKHIFCIRCLKEFYLNAINTGDIVSVRCLAPDCLKKSKEHQGDSNKHQKIKTLSPSELLQISLDRESVTRFVKLKHKLELESDKSTVYCPRKWCEGAARSSKHYRPLSLDDTSNLYEQSESESNNSNKSSSQKKLLSVCEDCLFAFCNRCFQSWHGDFTLCMPKLPGELSEDDKASLDYLKYHTTACPTCGVPSQKSYGCNHMICFRCNTHFCYLCSNWLSPSNPYKHYNTISSSCYMRLWELERGDAEDDEINIAEERANIGPNDNQLIQEAEIPLMAIHDVEEAPIIEEVIDERQAPNLPEFQREGPLVLRINHLPRFAQMDLAVQPVEATKRPNRGRRNLNLQDPPQRARAEGEAETQPHANQLLIAEDGAHHRWIQRFVELALIDEEDLIDWSSDDERDPIAWEIPIR